MSENNETSNVNRKARQTVAVAGATGFIGRALLGVLAEQYDVVALTRGKVDEASTEEQSISWRRCDLFSLRDTKQALTDCDLAVYLVHSMLPAAQLTQGSFQDMDLLVADNFATAAKEAGIKQIVYVGGIIPNTDQLSPHLRSRLEVEQALSAYGTPVTTLRAALIFGPGGSSTNIITRLVHRLPIMLCPSWTETKSQPVFIGDMVTAITHVLDRSECFDRYYDVGGATLLSYKDMMQEVARQMGRSTLILTLPVLTPQLSRLWVSLITGAPKNLVSPLIETLRHDMVPENCQTLTIPNHRFLSFEETLEKSRQNPEASTRVPRAFQLSEDEQQKRSVRSVQRLLVSDKYSVAEVARIYLSWLPEFLSPFLKVESEDQKVSLHFPCIPLPLLNLELIAPSISENREIFLIRGGLLAKTETKGRMEFRAVASSNCIIAAIHDFQPKLPWYIYRYTQAVAHLWVMNGFGRYLQKISVRPGP